jgi:hypothetical protein
MRLTPAPTRGGAKQARKVSCKVQGDSGPALTALDLIDFTPPIRLWLYKTTA